MIDVNNKLECLRFYNITQQRWYHILYYESGRTFFFSSTHITENNYVTNDFLRNENENIKSLYISFRNFTANVKI